MKIQNKELLISAINNCDKYNKSQKTLLSLFVSTHNNGIIDITMTSMVSLAKITRVMVYKNIDFLVEDGVISEGNSLSPRIKRFVLNEDALQEIIDLYLKRQEFIKSSLIK